MVEIARAVRHRARVIIFDEPTASLTPEEMQHLFHLLDSLRSQGVGIIFISHALEEALKIADRITVLRDGKLVHTGPARELDRTTIVRLMVGRDLAASHCAAVESEGSSEVAAPARPQKARERRRVLSVENITMGSIVKNMSFSVYEGEVVGMAGLVGSGRTEIAHIICGAQT
jgi:simple sugar transport system ATP-binding protein/ribose transport system ATP-binding protein